MNTIQQFLVIAGSALIIAGCQDANNASDVAINNVAEAQSAIDTVPKGRVDSTGRTDTTGRGDTTSPRYIDLSTGQPVDLYYDAQKNRVYSVMTNEPVDLYVDVTSGDTIYGTGRYVVNNYIVKSQEGPYKLDMNKVKIDKNEMKIKEGNKKFKMDKSNMKMKGAGIKMKGDSTRVKMKTGG